MIECRNNWSIGRIIFLLIAWFIILLILTHWLIDWFRFIYWLIDLWIDRLTGWFWLIDCLTGSLSDWLTHWFINGFVDWLIDWLIHSLLAGGQALCWDLVGSVVGTLFPDVTVHPPHLPPGHLQASGHIYHSKEGKRGKKEEKRGKKNNISNIFFPFQEIFILITFKHRTNHTL